MKFNLLAIFCCNPRRSQNEPSSAAVTVRRRKLKPKHAPTDQKILELNKKDTKRRSLSDSLPIINEHPIEEEAASDLATSEYAA